MHRSPWFKLVLIGVLAVAYYMGEGDLDVHPGPHAWVFLLVVFLFVFGWQWRKHRTQ